MYLRPPPPHPSCFSKISPSCSASRLLEKAWRLACPSFFPVVNVQRKTKNNEKDLMRGFLNTIKIDMNFLWSPHFLCNPAEGLLFIWSERLYFGGKRLVFPRFFGHKRLCTWSRDLCCARELLKTAVFQSRDGLTGNLPGQSNHESRLYSARGKKPQIPPLLLTSCAGYLAVPL